MTYNRFTDEDSKIDNCDYVQFNAFFTRDLDQDGYAEKIAGTCKEIGESDTLYMDINVLTQGYLKNGQITLNAKNFTWTTAIVDDNIVDGNYIGETSKIKLDDNVVNGSQKLLWGTINSKIGNNINDYSQISSVTLTGTYVSDDGQETEINKTVELTVDWYGITKTEVNKYYYGGESGFTNYKYQDYDIDTLIFNEDSVIFSFDAVVSEVEKTLLLQKQVLEITIPKLNGFSATEVTIKDTNIDYQYDESTGILTITRTAVVSEAGNIQKTISRANRDTVKITYPMEAYTKKEGNSVVLNIPIKGYNYGYNNTNEEFINPYVSSSNDTISVIYSKPKGKIWNIYPYVGNSVYNRNNNKYERIVSKENAQLIYNGNEYEDLITKYPVTWEIIVSDYKSIDNITLEEQKNENKNVSDKFLNTAGRYDNMYDYIKTTGIYFSNATVMLGDDGWIKLYNNETGSLLETFTSKTWTKYTEKNPYEVDLKSIKIETSKPVSNTALQVIQIKELNDMLITENYTQNDFDNLMYVYTHLKGAIKVPDEIKNAGGTYVTELNKVTNAYYRMPYSVSEISINPENITNQNTQNVNITIKERDSNIIESKWKNGRFLIEMPDNIINVSINSIETSNENVEILSYEKYEESGKYYIKIYTKNEEEALSDIKINADITANPLAPTSTQEIILYSYNEKCDNYYTSTQDVYDIDTDGNTNDNVGKTTCKISLISPSGLITTEYITNYDDEGNTTIAPNIAEIKKTDETITATINIGVTNNYNGTISNINILGKIPFKGNTYVINGEDLKSKFTATMKSEINVPEQLKNKITVYYSVNEKTNKNLGDETNNWVKSEQVKDWSKIRTYLIVFNNYVLQKDENQIFTYNVEVPAGLGYNTVSYSDHAVYYDLDTENGKLSIKTEPNKVGIQIASRYSMKLIKTKESYENVLIKGATYEITTTDLDEKRVSKTETTDDNGVITFSKLYIGKEYTLKEIAAPNDYEVNTNQIKFIADVNENGNIIIEVKEGNFSKTPQITTDEKGNYQIQTNLEDKAKYDLIINKSNENGEKLENVKFLINGKDQRNKRYKTNIDGIIKITGLCLDETYELSEIESDGYYTDEQPRKFKLVRGQDGEVTIQTQDKDLQKAVITENDTTIKPQVSINIVNKKIPTYNINVVKVEENAKEDTLDNLKKLENANFSLLSQDIGKSKEYSTDENGSISISGLYEYVDGKYITGKYTLQEIKAPEGYSNNAEEINFKAKRNEQGELQVEVENQSELESIKSVYVQDDTIYFVLQDKPLFKLTKIDSETGKLLANAKFVIYELNDELNVLDYAKDINGNYVGIKDENGDWIVTTDENGTITIPLREGKYRIDEVSYPEGYAEQSTTEYFIVSENETQDNEDDNNNKLLEINYIEDLVDLSKTTNEGNNYEGTTALLMRTLDFKEDSSYKNLEDTSYGDLNGDGKVEGIKRELTDEGGYGFTPIGKDDEHAFSGNFNGQGYEIRNLYINFDVNEKKYIGLFGYVDNSEIKNVGLRAGTITNIAYDYDESLYVGGIVGYIKNGNINSCYSTNIINLKNAIVYAGGIAGYVENGNIINNYNKGDMKFNVSDFSIGGIVGRINKGKINNCYNTGKIYNEDVKHSRYSDNKGIGGILGSVEHYDEDMDNCKNTGDISVSGSCQGDIYVGGISGRSVEINNSYNEGNIMVNIIDSSSIYVGGISGRSVEINNSYNAGDIDIKRRNPGTCYDGGITGWANSGIKNCYNIGNINLDELKAEIGTIRRCTSYNGGITGCGVNIEHCYNIGNINVNEDEIKDDIEAGIYCSYSGGITGEDSPYDNNYYLNTIDIKGTTINSSGRAVDDNYMKSKGFCMQLGNEWQYIPNNYPILKNQVLAQLKPRTELTIENTIKKFKITTDVNEINGVKGGSISGEDEEPYEIIKYGENSTKEIIMTPDQDYKITNITINGENIEYSINSDGTYTIPAGYFENMKENKHIVVTYGTGNNFISITKIDDLTAKLIPNTKFIIYEINENKEIIDYAKDKAGDYIGLKNEKGQYVVTTDENGKIELRLREGYYKAVEIEAAPGYVLSEDKEKNTTYFAKYDADFAIESIEDLVKLSNTVNSGVNYSSKTVILTKTLDFNDDNSYDNPNDTSYGDLNGDGTTEGIKAELTNKNGIGFTPIGSQKSFQGTFDGRGHEIRNIYINAQGNAGLFGNAPYAKIKNVGVTGSVSGSNAAGLAYLIYNGEITNCYSSAKIIPSSTAGGLVVNITGSKVINCYNLGNIEGTGRLGGFAFDISNSKVINCYNSGNINSSNGFAGGFSNGFSGNSEVINCYNTGKVNCKSAPATGMAFSINNGCKISNCYNAGELISELNLTAGIGWSDSGATITNTYYLNTSATSGIYNVKDVSGQIESKTEQEMKSKTFTDLLNENIKNISTDTTLVNWLYQENQYPTLEKETSNITQTTTPKYITPSVGIPTYTNGSNIEIKNQKGTDVIVHHDYKNPDGTYTTNEVATDDIYVGKVGDKYTTSPHVNLPDITLEKDANGKYVIPSNAVGTYSETPIEVTYYYEAQPIKLTIHHYLVGTEDKLVEDETIETQAQINFAEDGTYTITTNANYTINENSNYKKLIDKYNFVNVQTTIKENADISDTLEYNTTSELTYYYTSKQYQITTEVKPHKELRTNKTTGQKEEISVKGGTISGENETPYETVKHGENSEKEIKITPDKYYRVKTITLQSTKEDGTETTTVIYGENADENSEIKSVTNSDNTVTLTNFTNVTENKKIIVEFEIPMSTVIVHHIIVGQTQDYKTQEYVDYPEEDYNTSQIIIPGYVLVRKSENTSGKFETDVINVYYYYNNQFNYTVEYYYEDKETGDFVQDDDATEKTEALYGDIITEYQDKVKPGYVFDSVTPEDVNGKVKLIISGNEENNVIKVYYKLADFSYRVEYYYKDIDTKQYIQDTDKTDTFEAKYLDVIKSVNDKIITGYKFDKIEPEGESGSDETEDSSGTNVKKIATNLTITEIADNNVIKVYYSPANIGYTVEYYYDGIIDNTLTQGPIPADYQSIITTYEDKVKPGYVFINVTPVDNNNKVNLTITEDLSKNVIKVYYKSQYKITTDVIEHTENYSDGTVKQNVKGGTISGEDEEPYEKVIINENSTKPIIATPDQDYEIIGIKINDEILDYTNYEENGVVTLGEGYFKNMTENKHVIVEFRKKSKVTYNYLEETTNKKLADSEKSTGYDGKEYTPYSHEKAISNYELTKVQILDSKNNVIEEITEITEEKIKEIKKMYADDITVNYIYSRIKSNVVVKHIEINEKDQIGTVLDTENITGGVETTVTTNRKNYDGYISVDSPKDTETTAILVQANENSKDVIIKENTVIEVWYYYEKQFKINTEVIPHTENIDGNEVSVFGGTISKEYKKDENGEFILDQSGNKIEVDYEIVNNRGDNKKKIEIIPDNGYRIKKVTVNGEDVAIEDNSKKSLTLDEGYFTDIKNDILVSVEFERIPAKVIVKYLEYGTKETLNPDKIINGFVNDKYDEKRVDISGYIPCNENGEKSSSTTGDLSDIEPDNSKGVMTENDIVVIYYYTKEFIITTDIDEHLEYEDDVLDIRTDKKNDDKSEDNKNDGDNVDSDKADDNKSDESKKQKLVKGGTITSELTPENQEPVETVLKGKNSTKPIIIKPDKGYRIKTVKIYEGEKDENGKFEKQPIILDLEEFISKEELEKGGTITIPESYFKNVQSNKHIVTEFEKIPVMIIVNYLDVETNSRVAKSEYAQGTIDQKYLTSEKQIDFYNIVEEKIPENKEGNLSEKQIETSIENKLDMLNKLNSELSDKSDETTEKLIEILKNKNVVIVNYYYKKLPFNLSINKEFTSVKVNGIERLGNDNKFVELSIPNTEISNTNIDVTYKITVTNTEQIEGKAVILEQIPVGFEVVEKQNSEWKLNESGDLQLTTEVLKPGESVEYEIELHWNEKMKCFGLLENIVKINETRNLCGFDETRLDDNKDSCKLVLSVRTGKYGVTKNMVAISCVILAEILTVVYVVSEVRDRKRSE